MSHATNLGIPDGTHFMPEKQCDSMVSTDCTKKSHVTDPGEPSVIPHSMPNEQCDSMASKDRGKMIHATDQGKPDGVHFMPKEQEM